MIEGTPGYAGRGDQEDHHLAGMGKMKLVVGLDGKQVADVIAFVRTLKESRFGLAVARRLTSAMDGGWRAGVQHKGAVSNRNQFLLWIAAALVATAAAVAVLDWERWLAPRRLHY